MRRLAIPWGWVVALLPACGGTASPEALDASPADATTSDSLSVEGAPEADVTDAPYAGDAVACPTDRPISGSPCPMVGLVCGPKCGEISHSVWKAECEGRPTAPVWDVWQVYCGDAEKW